MNTVEVLLRAKDLVAESWVGRNPGSDEHCLTTALKFACREEFHEYYDCCQVVRNAIGSGILSAWNDIPGRTKEEVLDAIDAAIRIVKDREEK